jgi:hypothetical protein
MASSKATVVSVMDGIGGNVAPGTHKAEKKLLCEHNPFSSNRRTIILMLLCPNDGDGGDGADDVEGEEEEDKKGGEGGMHYIEFC